MGLSLISLKLHKHRGGYWRKKLPWTILEEQFPVARNTDASEIGNGVISLLWQPRRYCNPDRNPVRSGNCSPIVANGDVVDHQTWEVLTLKNPIEPPSLKKIVSSSNGKPTSPRRYRDKSKDNCFLCQHFQGIYRAVFTWLSKGIGFGFGFGFTTPFGWLVYLLWFWFYDSQVKTALCWNTESSKQNRL